MRQLLAISVFGAMLCAASTFPRAAALIPDWAYAIPQPPPGGAAAAPAATPDTSPKQLPGSTLTFTRQQISDGFGPADWFPGDHPKMPEIVAHGKRPDVRACGLCHYPNGKGRLRKSSESRKANTNLMIQYAKLLTPEELKEAAEYFGAMPWTPWVRVVETSTVPKMVSRGGIWIPVEGGEKEPIGTRIIETPENPERTEILRDPRSGFIAYAPMGSIKKGEALAKNGGGKTVECGTCHGADLKGLGPVPGIAGRSPSYLVRQMYDMQTGARHGEWAELMKPVVAKLGDEDLVNIAAYVSSLLPPRASSSAADRR